MLARVLVVQPATLLDYKVKFETILLVKKLMKASGIGFD
jgi:hypothetical protein